MEKCCEWLNLSQKNTNIKKTLPSSWNWEDSNCKYKNEDCQPDKSCSIQKQTILETKLKKLLLINEYEMTRLEYIINKIRNNYSFPEKIYYFNY